MVAGFHGVNTPTMSIFGIQTQNWEERCSLGLSDGRSWLQYTTDFLKPILESQLRTLLKKQKQKTVLGSLFPRMNRPFLCAPTILYLNFIDMLLFIIVYIAFLCAVQIYILHHTHNTVFY